MTPETADALAKRIINCWRGGPPLDEWRDVLIKLDEGRAGTAYIRLRDDLENAPSIKAFLATYRNVHTTDGGNRQQCHWCDNTGWTQTADHVRAGAVYSGVEPCTHCDEGRARETSEAWTKSTVRDFVSEAESARLVAATRARYTAPKPTGDDAA